MNLWVTPSPYIEQDRDRSGGRPQRSEDAPERQGAFSARVASSTMTAPEPTDGQRVIDAVIEVAQRYDCRISHWEERGDGAPAYDVVISSPLRDRCDIVVYLDDPPTLANVSVGVGDVWIEWWSEDLADAIENCVWFVEETLAGRVREQLHYIDDIPDWSELTYLATDDIYHESIPTNRPGNFLRQFTGKRRSETIYYVAYPPAPGDPPA